MAKKKSRYDIRGQLVPRAKFPRYQADPETHYIAKEFYKRRGLKLGDVIDALLNWNMSRVERAENALVHSRSWEHRPKLPIGLALPEDTDE